MSHSAQLALGARQNNSAQLVLGTGDNKSGHLFAFCTMCTRRYYKYPIVPSISGGGAHMSVIVHAHHQTSLRVQEG